MRPSLLAICLSLAVAACSPPEALQPATKILEVGPLRVGSGHASVDAAEIGWVTGFQAEALDEAGKRLDRAWLGHAELRLDNETQLLVVTSRTPEILFPAGFALPLAQILRDMPAAWRGASVLATTGGEPAGPPVSVRTTIRYLPATRDGRPLKFKSLYVLSLSGNAAEEQEPAAQGQRKKYSYLVPVDSTVHYGVVYLPDRARYMRLTDLNDGKVLWQADAGPRPGQVAGEPVYSSETGFPLYREHEYEVEVMCDAAGPEPIDAVMYLYYHPPGNEEFGYPYPPPGESAAP